MTPAESDILYQNPIPGTRLLRFAGDLQRFTLELKAPEAGTAWLRTNIGWSGIGRREIIDAVEQDKAQLGRDWFDIPMVRCGEDRFEVSVPLAQVGHFEAKCYFQQADGDAPLWPSGDNVTVNVEPAQTCCGNTIYNAFVRQFGPNKTKRQKLAENEQQVVRRLDETGFAVIPPSGTFRDLIGELDFIIGTLGCRYLQLLPINPTPTTYARMGRFGSPYAALSFTAVDPALARFDPKATPLEQFTELVDAVHLRGGLLLLDLAINHTGWAAALHESHPDWLRRDPAGRIENPGAWGITWADLTELDYRHRELWKYIAGVFRTWCRRGVDGFRCDAGYMVPLPAWKYIIAKVREQYPDTIFFLEGLGGKISVTRDLLNRGDFNWAYSELFQNYDRGAIEGYLPGALDISHCDGITIHFCETHDNNRLAATSRRFSRLRTALCALASVCGGFAFANGVEWFATEKINVHESPSLNWGATKNQVEEIRRLTALLHHHPAFFDRTHIEMVQEGDGNVLVLWRRHKPTTRQLLVVVNLDAEKPVEACWDPSRVPMGREDLVDLLSGKPVSAVEADNRCRLALDPGQVLCLTERPEDLDMVRQAEGPGPLFDERLRIQRLRAKALEVFKHLRGTGHLEAETRDDAARRLAEDPAEFCRTAADPGDEPRVASWKWPADVRREVMVPPGFFLLVTAGAPFRVRIRDPKRCLAAEDSLRSEDGRFFALICPLSPSDGSRVCTVDLSVYEPGGSVHRQGRLRLLSPFAENRVRSVFGRPELLSAERLLLGTNGLGGMLRTPVSWGQLRSRYDALLAANLNPEAPDDRRVFLARCRAWSVFQGTSQPIGDDCLDAFTTDGASRGYWRFRLPTGQGQHVALRLAVEMVEGKNAVRMLLYREPSADLPDRLADPKPIRVIVRPDIEDRSFHEVTKAYMGPETHFPAAVHPKANGFDFLPGPDRALSLRASTGAFVPEPEWHYMVHRPVEAERGLDPDSDLFSPGYIDARLKGGEQVEITAAAGSRASAEAFDAAGLYSAMSDAFSRKTPFDPPAVMKGALAHYVVRRRSLSTVIAGYPWFLDWGRDTLIFVRGLIAAGQKDTAARILKQFAAFEEYGTLPNMIRGSDAGNRDTSDAPLWFFAACADLCEAERSDAFLDARIGSRSVRNILRDMGRSMIAGTPNGIRVDPDSGLMFSPAHFTWMDTNHPAGTPREGYPVEIQALWWAALRFLVRIETESSRQSWQRMADQVRRSLAELYTAAPHIGLSDCLHGSPGTPARQASADDALRPNQLFAVTLGAVEPGLGRRVVKACASLLVPGAIRSLADQPIQHGLEIRHQGNLLVDPHHPYQGRYLGDEDTHRKPAYHNGTAWTWVFPSFCEAWADVFPETGRQTALAYLGSGVHLLETGCIGHLPEILDGDSPHAPRGCDAQAWGASEYLRVWKKISGA